MGPDEAEATPAELFMTTAPADDAGARTADLYDWQAAMATADGLALYRDALDEHGRLPADHDCRIVCERHEDWAAVNANDVELVSAKHREPSSGAYTTLTQLTDDGGLGHLFDRWHSLQEKPTCRLVTTAGLGAGAPQNLARACVALRDGRLTGCDVTILGDHEAVIADFLRALARYFSGRRATGQSSRSALQTEPQPEQVARFISMLQIEDNRPARGHIPYAAPAMYARPVLDRLGNSATPPEAVWEAALSLFRVRMRAAGPIPSGSLPTVLAYRPGSPPPDSFEIERGLAARIVTLTDIDIAVHTAIASPRGYLPLMHAIRTSRVAVKMAVGLCTDNSIERAEQLRLDYQKYWRVRTNGDPTARADQDRLRRALLHISDDATTAATKSVGPWGPELWTELQARINTMPTDLGPVDMDGDLLLGGMCDLANRCQVWFSDRFDVADATARMLAQRGSRP